MENEIKEIENEIKEMSMEGGEGMDKGGCNGDKEKEVKGKGSKSLNKPSGIKSPGKSLNTPSLNKPSLNNTTPTKSSFNNTPPTKSTPHSLDTEISFTKSQINNLKFKLENSLDNDLKDVQIDLKIQNEKIEILEKRNQDIKIFLSDLPVQMGDKENQLLLAEKEIKKIKINEIEENLKKKFKDLEKDYNLILNSFKESQEEMNNLKKKMGDNYHNEIDLKNKYEDLEEKIGEYEEGIKKNKEKIKKIKKEIGEYEGMVVESDYKGEEDEGKEGKVKGNDKGKKGKLTPLNTLNNPDTPTLNINNPDTLNPTLNTPTLTSSEIHLFIKNQESLLSKFSPKEILPGVFEDFILISDSYKKAQNDFDLISDSYKSKRNKIENLKSKRYEDFMEGFKIISKNLKEIYKTLTYGGNAELELVDYLDPFSEGVVLAVMPPKKCWKNVNNLSGGEKTLSSLSLIFALHKYKPSPFYVMDEIDAALDYRNVSIISNYIKEMTKNSQFIVISLRSDMFEMSKTILGIYKTKNISKFLMIKVDKVSGRD